MKKTYVLSLFLFTLLSVSVYFLTYKVSRDIYEEERNQTEIKSEDLLVLADTNTDQTVTNTTKYILEYYNSKEFTLEEQSLPTPADFVGLTREELIDYLKGYEASPSLEDKQLGFESFELVSFSKDQIVLRKTYHPYADNYKYFLVAENGFITVYYADKSTVYEYTNISTEDLPNELKEEVVNGKYITTLDDLYNFLENYSS